MSAQVDFEGVEGRHYLSLDRIRIDTIANRTSVISMGQYNAYCAPLNLPHWMQRIEKGTTTGIGETSKATGAVVMKVPVQKLGVVIVVAFSVLKEQIPTLLSMNNMSDEIYIYTRAIC